MFVSPVLCAVVWTLLSCGILLALVFLVFTLRFRSNRYRTVPSQNGKGGLEQQVPDCTISDWEGGVGTTSTGLYHLRLGRGGWNNKYRTIPSQTGKGGLEQQVPDCTISDWEGGVGTTSTGLYHLRLGRGGGGS